MLFNPLNKKCMNKKCFLLMLFMLWSCKTEFRFSDHHDPGTDLSFLLWGFWYQPARQIILYDYTEIGCGTKIEGNRELGRVGLQSCLKVTKEALFKIRTAFEFQEGSAFLRLILFTRWRLWRTRQSLYRNAIARVPNPLPSYITSFMCLSCKVLSLLTNYS